MPFGVILLALLGAMVAPFPASAIETYSSSQFHQVIATAVIPDRNDEQLYFSVIAGTFFARDIHKRAASDGIYYQFSGTVDIEVGDKTKTLHPGEGVFIPAGAEFTITTNDAHSSPTYLNFLLSSVPGADIAGEEDGPSIEVYRSPSPVPGLMHERNLLSLTRVPVPPQSPADPPHRRTGASLHYILSGVGAEFADGRAVARGPGSVSFEPAGVTYQWSNPGLNPLIYLLFNINPRDAAPVVGMETRPADPFSRDPHLTVAMYCVAISMIVTLVVSSGALADYHRGKRNKTDRHDDRP